MSERMRFGQWTCLAYDVNFGQKYFNLTVCCFIKCKKFIVYFSKSRNRCVVNCQNSLGGRA